MARLFSGILGVSVAALALGGVHLEMASGSDLDTFKARYEASALLAPGASPAVNREDKADRVAAPTLPQAALRTLSIKVEQLENTSVLIRVPADRADGTPLRPSQLSPIGKVEKKQQRRIVACEPVVSALTEVAKLLDSGRCVT